MALRLVTLGGLRVFKDGQEIPLPVQRRARAALLVYLAVERETTREQVASVFWPESDEEKARHALSQALYALRSMVGEEWLLTDGDRLRALSSLQIDIEDFEQGVERGAYDVALSLFRAPFLASVGNLPDSKPFETWLDSRRARYERLHRRARRAYIKALLDAGNTAAALAAARDWTQFDPVADEPQHRLIELLVASGQPAEAVQVYESYERLLAADDLEPLDETKELIASVRTHFGEPLVAPPAPPRAIGGLGSMQRMGATLRRGPQRFRRAVALAAVLMGVSLVGWVVLGKRKVAAQLDMNAVAILPFHASTDQSLQYLDEGIVDLLATKLSSEAGLRAVSPRTTIKAWLAVPGGPHDADERDALEVARRFGAGQFVFGSVVGNSDWFFITATLFNAANGSERVRATVSGSADSLLIMVDRLAAELLSRGAGEHFERLASLTTTSLDALKLYLNGRAAYRDGDFRQALQLLEQALAVDSTFALAGLLHSNASVWAPTQDPRAGYRVAWAHRDRLSDRDRAAVELLHGDIGNQPLKWVLDGCERLVEAAPDDAEAVFRLADNYFHFGAAIGVPDAEERALKLMQRSLELDSTFLPALSHTFEFEAVRMDDRLARDYASRYLDAQRRHPNAVFGRGLKLRIAQALHDSTMLREFYGTLDTPRVGLDGMVISAAFHGHLPLQAARHALAVQTKAALSASARMQALLVEANFAAWTGRPQAAVRLAQETLAIDADDANSHAALRALIDYAIWYEGDTIAARRAARELDRRLAGPAADIPAVVPYRDHCALASWDLAQGDIPAATRRLERIRAAVDAGKFASYSSVAACATWLTAELAHATHSPEAPYALARLDSLLQVGTFTILFALERGNSVSMRIHEQRGEHEAALAAARRQIVARFPPVDITVQLLGQARSAARLGHADEAIRAYRRYLVIRNDPEPGTRAERVVNAVRAELAQLIREERRDRAKK